LPPGIHPASLSETLQRFGAGTPQRKLVATRLTRIYRLAVGTGQLNRCVVFGSFVTGKRDPNDVDVFLSMNDGFDLNAVAGEARILFDHAAAQACFGASVFWLRRFAAYPNEEELIAGWQLRRDGAQRGIVEVTKE
jgi:hypothetical protein